MKYIEEFYLFVKVVQEGGFSHAAAALGMPTGTISRRISQLEEQLGCSLLHRSTRKLRLTDEGLVIEVFDTPDAPLFDPDTAQPAPILSDIATVLADVLVLAAGQEHGGQVNLLPERLAVAGAGDEFQDIEPI